MRKIFSIPRASMLTFSCGALLLFANSSCNTKPEAKTQEKIRIITLDPGHFHAALLQKSMYDEIDSVVHIYAPDGSELENHMKLVESYNSRPDNPTSWKSQVYRGDDYLEKMFSEDAGNVVIISGNNKSKTKYITMAIDSGMNVLADKPLAIDNTGFKSLEAAFKTAKDKNVLLYDIMTERYNIYYMLQRELSQDAELFGTLEKGSHDNPAVMQESVHHFYKNVSGKPLVRPAWFFDVEQEGHGLVDITTHMVDLIQWECFPEVALDYTKDIKMLSAKQWPTLISPEQFRKSTKKDQFPDYLSKYVKNNTLEVMSNGEMNYTIKDVHARVSIKWNFEAPDGTGDTHFSQMRGTKANLVIKQGKEQQFKPVVYIDPMNNTEQSVQAAIDRLQKKFSGVSVKKTGDLWEIVIPENLKVGHEDHFAEVVKKYLQYLKAGELPSWEVPNMLSKYYTTTQALEMAKANK
ncbi:putative oxidoreductase C-terminal domain-containing protein [Daejeonella sp. JGW-45]|uniref:putative oxidoreductase C-terminal domain-containing protein n=1 Tax=Daejeonella sp. JGW-45 TaxID=3034148 RepID=UPI0023EC493A|nr:putative oxidoreductase C-terminal domain-containing protein [Daejeonella sp. JGW-45]